MYGFVYMFGWLSLIFNFDLAGEYGSIRLECPFHFDKNTIGQDTADFRKRVGLHRVTCDRHGIRVSTCQIADRALEFHLVLKFVLILDLDLHCHE